MKKTKTEHYDSFAKDFAKTRKNQYWKEFDWFLPKLEKNDRFLDLGCGGGRLRSFVSDKLVQPGQYFGIDISQEMVSVSRSEYPKDNWFKGSMTDLPFGADQFHWVAGIASFHHLLSAEDQRLTLQEIHRVLRTNGQVFLSVWVLPSKYFWPNFWKGRVFSKNWIIPFGKEKHLRIYRSISKRKLAKLLKKNGFKVSKCEIVKNRNVCILATKI